MKSADGNRLYGLPLAEFTAARDARVRTLRREGRRDEADAVAALRKPVLAAWLVNQLARARRAEVRDLVRAAEGVKKGRRGSEERFRETADGLVRAARELLTADGGRASEAVLRDVATTLRAAAAADPELLAAGQLTQPLESSGFEAMAGAAPRRRERERAPTPAKEAPAARRARLEGARKALAAARTEARRLRRAADAAEAEARKARAAADRADELVAEAEERVAQEEKR